MTGSRRRVAILLLLVFAAGAAAGVAADRLQLLPGTANAEEASGEADRSDDRGRRQTTIERFADELGLTSAQRARIEEILDGFRDEVKELRREFEPRWHALIDTTRARIEARLTDEQVSQYRDLLEQERERRRSKDRRYEDEKEKKEKEADEASGAGAGDLQPAEDGAEPSRGEREPAGRGPGVL